MRDRVKQVYLMLGNVLNNPRAFGLEERPPRPLQDVLSRMQKELMEELLEKAEDEGFLAMELSQDADDAAVAGTSISFTLPEGG
jgi:hypothetical protein